MQSPYYAMLQPSFMQTCVRGWGWEEGGGQEGFGCTSAPGKTAPLLGLTLMSLNTPCICYAKSQPRGVTIAELKYCVRACAFLAWTRLALLLCEERPLVVEAGIDPVSS